MPENKTTAWSKARAFCNWYLRASLLFPVGLALLLVLERAGNFHARVALLEARQVLFGVRFDDQSFVTATPGDLQAQFSFSTNDEESVDHYRPELAAVLERQSMQGRIENFDDWASDVTQNISGFGGLACGEYKDLPDAVGKLVHGADGCCSDHTMVFLAIAAFDGVFARELHNAEHTFVEYWHPGENRYIWMDPYLGLRASRDGRHLGLADILQLIDHGATWQYEIIGAANPARNIDLKKVKGLRPEDFIKIGMTLGNDVFDEDLAARQVRSLPRPFAQTLLLITGKKPTIGFNYERMRDQRPVAYYYRYVRYLLIFQTIMTSIAILGVIRGFMRRRRATV